MYGVPGTAKADRSTYTAKTPSNNGNSRRLLIVGKYHSVRGVFLVPSVLWLESDMWGVFEAVYDARRCILCR
jgi:hypothetical protein